MPRTSTLRCSTVSYFPEDWKDFFSLFSIAISAAETAVAIAIMINIYRNIRSIQVNKLDEMKW